MNNKENFEKYYEKIEVFESEKNIHYKACIKKRNEKMVERSDLVVCYVHKNFGGAYEAMRDARNKDKLIYQI